MIFAKDFFDLATGRGKIRLLLVGLGSEQARIAAVLDLAGFLLERA